MDHFKLVPEYQPAGGGRGCKSHECSLWKQLEQEYESFFAG